MKLVLGVDYYMDGKLFVLTEGYLRRRGACCRNGCRHCPFSVQDSDRLISNNRPDSDSLSENPINKEKDTNPERTRMAISPIEALQLSDEKKKLSPDEILQADAVEAQIDQHVKRSYDGHGKVVVSIQRPAPRVVSELERRYTKAGWGFVSSSGEVGRSGQGFSITLTAPNTR